MTEPTRKLVLASQSPRRLMLLREAGYAVEVIPAHADELWPENLPPAEAVVVLAMRKAQAVAGAFPDQPVLGADTAVVIDDEALGKPESRSEAADMLNRLAGRTHTVFSGVALVRGAYSQTGCERSDVTFHELSAEKIEQYLDHAEYMDKAGAYGIQEHGRELVVSHTGRVDTIVGLPMNVVDHLMQQIAKAA